MHQAKVLQGKAHQWKTIYFRKLAMTVATTKLYTGT